MTLKECVISRNCAHQSQKLSTNYFLHHSISFDRAVARSCTTWDASTRSIAVDPVFDLSFSALSQKNRPTKLPLFSRRVPDPPRTRQECLRWSRSVRNSLPYSFHRGLFRASLRTILRYEAKPSKKGGFGTFYPPRVHF
jgi:hypothetical protein